MLFLLICNITKAQDLKKEAEGFYNEIVQSYFNDSCKGYYEKLNDSLLGLTSEGIAIAALKDLKTEKEICEKIKFKLNTIESIDSFFCCSKVNIKSLLSLQMDSSKAQFNNNKSLEDMLLKEIFIKKEFFQKETLL